MEQDQIGEGFPNICGHHVDSFVTCPRPGELLILFHQTPEGGAFIREVRVFLIGCQMIESNVTLQHFYTSDVISFPRLTSYELCDDQRSSGKHRILRLMFAKGSLSWKFTKSYFLITNRPLGNTSSSAITAA